MSTKTTAIVSVFALGQAIGIVLLPAGSAAAAPTPVGATAMTVASGSVESAGQPVAGAQTIVYAWPANSVLADLTPGQTVPISVVGTATTDSSGQYVMSAPQTVGLASAAAPDGTVNLEAVTLASGEFASYSFSSTLSQMASGPISLPAVSAVPAANVQAADVTGFAQTAHAAASTAAAASAGTAADSAAAAPQAVPCGWVYLRTYAPAWTVVGATYDTTTDVTQHFTYTQGQSSSLGVGLSSSGKAGSFSVSGSASITSSATEDFPPSTGAINTRYETEFRNAEYGYSCGLGFLSYETRPSSFAGGARSVSTGYPNATYCVYQEKGSTFTENTSSAYTFGAGALISEIGLNITAQTGYDNSASISYYFGIAHYLCGTNGYPGEVPKQLVAGRV